MPVPFQNPYTSPYGYAGFNPYQPQQFQSPPVQPSQTLPQQPQPPQQQVQYAAPAPMTPPTVHVDIIRVNTAEEVNNFPVNAGTTAMFQVGDGEAFITKEVLANGQCNIDVYAKQPRKPSSPPFDMSQVVTWDKLEQWADDREAEGSTSRTRRGRKRQDDGNTGPES